eukprot:COSAG05_NODE_2486_length_3002_cov_6.420510_2_plen_149_part_01
MGDDDEVVKKKVEFGIEIRHADMTNDMQVSPPLLLFCPGGGFMSGCILSPAQRTLWGCHWPGCCACFSCYRQPPAHVKGRAPALCRRCGAGVHGEWHWGRGWRLRLVVFPLPLLLPALTSLRLECVVQDKAQGILLEAFNECYAVGSTS